MAPPSTTPTTSQLLLEWDRRRGRSQQRELGMSEIGECRRRAGYRLADTEPSNAGSSVQAVMGTAIHESVASVLKQLQAEGVIPAEDLIEQEVRFAGVLGHLDRHESAIATLVDVKTTSSNWLRHIKTYGADQQHIWQASLYAAALIHMGLAVRQIRIDYLARDTGEEYPAVHDFDPQHVADALAWLKNVRETPLEMLARDRAPDGPFCGHCPFFDTCWSGGRAERDKRSVLLIEAPEDTQKWAEQLWQGRQLAKRGKELADEAKGVLDALRPDLEEGESAIVDCGWRMRLKWRKKRGARQLDKAAIEADYKAAGAKVPYTKAKGALELVFDGDDVEESDAA